MSNLIAVKGLKTHFFYNEGVVKAVDGVDFTIDHRKTLGVVGESGCGKSVTARSILKIVGESGKIVEGTIKFWPREDDKCIDLTTFDPKGPAIRKIRGKEISMIFQEPMTSLSPVHTIGSQIMEALILHRAMNKKQAREVAADMLDRVGIPDPYQRLNDYPHSISGGMRQRVMIAMALCCRPKLLIADEPTTALDVTIQAQILDLMSDLQEEFDMAIMLITHNLGVVANIADNVVVMYLGKVVETAPVKELFARPLHPYTKALLQSVPRLGKTHKQALVSIKGAVPDAYNIPKGCRFHPRCALYQPGLCDHREPPSVDINSEHSVSCFLANEVD